MQERRIRDVFDRHSTRDTFREFLGLFMVLFVIALIGLFLFTQSGYRKSLAIRKSEEIKRIELMKFSMLRDLGILSSDLRTLRDSEALLHYVMDPKPVTRKALENRFNVFASDRRIYEQIRYIGRQGREKVRINYRDGIADVVAEENLQNKRERYYFKETLSRPNNSIFFSLLDLNVENHKIDIPYRPVFRVSTPVYAGGSEPDGILILNYKASLMLERFDAAKPAQGSTTDYSLLNKDGYWIKASDPGKEWGFLLENGKTFSDEYPRVFEKLSKSGTGQFHAAGGLFVFDVICPGGMLESDDKNSSDSCRLDDREHWYLVARVPLSDLTYTAYLKEVSDILVFFLAGIIVLIIGCWQTAESRLEKRNMDNLFKLLSEGLEQSPVAVIITDWRGMISYVNPTFESMSGYSYHRCVGRNARMLKSGNTPEDVYEELWTAIKKGRRWSGTIENRHKEGHAYTVAVQISPIIGKKSTIEHFIGIQEDITEKLELQRKLERAATLDHLTGVANRGHFMKQGDREIRRLARYNHSASVMVLDIDRFKQINDSYGHAAGDRILQEFTQTVRKELRGSDLLGRIGGEEFAVLLPETDREGNQVMAQRLCDRVRGLLVIYDDARIRFTVSIGCAVWQPSDKNLSGVLRRADEALYQAKNSGRDTVRSI